VLKGEDGREREETEGGEMKRVEGGNGKKLEEKEGRGKGEEKEFGNGSSNVWDARDSFCKLICARGVCTELWRSLLRGTVSKRRGR